ncbi:MAG: hypothetical protein J1F35_03445 [Erysipelotrichales bacterium]|nr:hypothetical protein [Erysipelotrichales bacterium]
MEDKALVLYHKEDNDGVFSGALFRNYFIYDLQLENENVICQGLDYNDVKKIDKEYIDNISEFFKYIVITDISLPVDLMNYIYNLFGNEFVWIDHHAPIIKEAEQKYKASETWTGVRQTDRSAILCAYKYLYDPFDECYNHKYIPELLRILSAWDSFTYKENGYELDYVRGFNKAVNQEVKLNIIKASEIIDYEDYEMDAFIEKCNAIGKSIVEYEDYINNSLVESSADIEWTIGEENRKAAMLVMQGPSSSLIFESLKNTDIKNGIIFKYNCKENAWVISLYNINEDDKDFHCGEYLKTNYKGGGHLGAAGCQVSFSQFLEMMKSKHI